METKINLLSENMIGLTWGFQVNPVSCGNNTHYENYIRFIAISDNKIGCGTTHVLIGKEDDKEVLIGFVTLRASSFVVMENDLAHGSAAIEIMELAVDQRYEKCGYGTKLIDYAIAVADEVNDAVMAVKYIVLCADSSAVAFYKSNGFERVSDYGYVPRNGANDDCVPMIMRIRD